MLFTKTALAVTMVAGLVAATPASAAVVVSQQPSVNFAGPAINRSDAQNFLNQFSLAAATNLNGFDLGTSQVGLSVGQNVTIKIRGSVSGAPELTNLYSFTTTISAITGGYVHADFSNILLGAGTYFIGMTGTGFNLGQDIYRDDAFPNKLVQLSGDNIQFRNGFVSPFRIYGDVAAAPVPEPATWAMMMLGFGAMGAAVRRRKTNVSARMRFA